MSGLRKFNIDFIEAYMAHKGHDQSPEVITERLNVCREEHGLKRVTLKRVGAIVLQIKRARGEAPPAPPRANAWPAEDIALLREMRGRGETSTAIAKRLGKTRSAAIGMAYRLRRSAPQANACAPQRRSPMKATDLRLRNAWLPAEDATATNLYEHGVHAREIADTLNQLYRKGRGPESVRTRMHVLGVVWGCRSADPEIRAQRLVFARSARVRAEAAEAQERAPWHPLKDNARLLAVLTGGR